MFSKILVKLVDQAIVPAIMLLASRVISVIALGRYFDKEIIVNNAGFEFATPQDYVLINSYSILVMLAVISVGLLYILLKSFYVHDSHVTPHLTAKLFSLRLSSFIQTSFDLYSQGTVWTSYLYLMLLVSGVMVAFGLIYSWVFLAALVLSIVTTVLFVLDIENEVDAQSKSLDGFSEMGELEDELVLKFGESDE